MTKQIRAAIIAILTFSIGSVRGFTSCLAFAAQSSLSALNVETRASQPPKTSLLYDDTMRSLRDSDTSYEIESLYDIFYSIDPDFSQRLPKKMDEIKSFVDQHEHEFMETINSYKKKNKEKLMGSFKYLQEALSVENPYFDGEATIEDFGLDNGHTDCAYDIFRRPSIKRIVLTFRGTEQSNPRDLFQDGKIFTTTMDAKTFLEKEVDRDNLNSTIISNFVKDKNNVTLHDGWREYYFVQKRKGMGRTTHDIIEAKLVELMGKKENEGFELYITGHSMGGALSTMSAFALATNDKLPVPIKLITFASPQPGHVDLVEVIEKLGQLKRLYHLRVTNNDDIAAQFGVFSTIWTFFTGGKYIGFNNGFRHSGVHLNLFSKGAKTTLKQTVAHTASRKANGMTFKFWKFPKYHHSVEYKRRLEMPETKELLRGKTWDDLEKKYYSIDDIASVEA